MNGDRSILEKRLSVDDVPRLSKRESVKMLAFAPHHQNRKCSFCKHFGRQLDKCENCLSTEELEGFVPTDECLEDDCYLWMEQHPTAWGMIPAIQVRLDVIRALREVTGEYAELCHKAAKYIYTTCDNCGCVYHKSNPYLKAIKRVKLPDELPTDEEQYSKYTDEELYTILDDIDSYLLHNGSRVRK